MDMKRDLFAVVMASGPMAPHVKRGRCGETNNNFASRILGALAVRDVERAIIRPTNRHRRRPPAISRATASRTPGRIAQRAASATGLLSRPTG